MWLWWLGACLILVVVEMLTVDFIFLMFAGGTLAAMVAALLGAPLWAQVVVFSAVAVLLLFVARPPLKAWVLSRTPETRTNARALEGMEAVVVQAVSADAGQVKLQGEIWTARTDGQHTLTPGERVVVTEIQGAIAKVSPTYAQEVTP